QAVTDAGRSAHQAGARLLPGVRDGPGVAEIAARMRPYFGSAVRVEEEGEVLSQLMRDAAARGVTRQVLAADLHLRIWPDPVF
ncbi:MAG: hypothetical protein LH471_02025, partial [Salinibacterium sp.]|nr:hypothetical protein [Salinibacterium sp.]